jgi:hypothetical protein
MPVLKYFLWVGGSLLALLLAADFYLPKQPQRTETHHSYNIPIAAPARPDSQAVTFSGPTRNFGQPPPMTVVDFAARPNGATPPANDTATHARAQMTGAPAAEQRANPVRQKVAKRKIKRQRAPTDHDVARLPDAWHRDQPMGFAFARPFSW